MDNFNPLSAVTIDELTRLVREFEEKVQTGTEDPDCFLTLAELECLWGKLIGDTNVVYSDMVQHLLKNVDEKTVVHKKKLNT